MSRRRSAPVEFGVTDCQTLCGGGFAKAIAAAIGNSIYEAMRPSYNRRRSLTNTRDETKERVEKEVCKPQQWRRRAPGSNRWTFRQCRRSDDCPHADDYDDEE